MKTPVILVVDDDESILHLTRVFLERDGHHVLTAGSPLEARRLIEQLPPDLVISDLVMEPIDGFDFIASLQASGIPVLVMSSVDNLKSVAHAATLGVKDYIVKPFQASAFLEKVKKHLKS